MWSRLRTAHSFWLRIVHDSWRFVPVLKSNDCRRSLRTCVRRFLKQCARFSKACARAHVYVHVSWRFVLCLAQIFTSIGVSVHDSAKLVPVLTYMCMFHENLCFVWPLWVCVHVSEKFLGKFLRRFLVQLVAGSILQRERPYETMSVS